MVSLYYGYGKMQWVRRKSYRAYDLQKLALVCIGPAFGLELLCDAEDLFYSTRDHTDVRGSLIDM